MTLTNPNVSLPVRVGQGTEDLLEAALEAGADDVEEDEDEPNGEGRGGARRGGAFGMEGGLGGRHWSLGLGLGHGGLQARL